MNRRLKRWTVVLSPLLSFVAAGCSVKKKSGAASNSLRLALGTDPTTLDPQIADTGVSLFVAGQVLSTLFRYDAQQRIVNYDAESWDWNPNGTTLRVLLKEALTWSDGRPLQACDYREGILRALDPATPGQLVDLLYPIQNAEARKQGSVPAEKVGVRCANAERRLEFDVVRPRSPEIFHALAFLVSAPVRTDREWTPNGRWLLASGERPALGTGAFVVREWTRDRRIVLAARPDAPADRRARLATVEMPIVRDPSTAFSMYEAGEVDLLEELPPSLLPKLMKRTDLVTSPYFTTYMVGFSLSANPVLKNSKVRRALVHAFDPDEIPILLKGGEMPAYGWVPPGLLDPAALPKSRFSAKDASALLDEAGYKDRSKFPKLKLFYNAGERHKLLMERVAYAWKERLGIEVELNPIEWKVLVSQLKSQPPDLYRYAWAAAYPDALFFLGLFQSKNANNFGAWSNREYDSLLEQLRGVPYEKRDAAYWKKVARAQEILTAEDPAVLPIYHYVRNVLVRPGLKGFEFGGRGTGLLTSVEWSGEAPTP